MAQKEINEQVGKPFIKAFNNDDNEALKAVHSKAVIRAIRTITACLDMMNIFKKFRIVSKQNRAIVKKY